MHALQKKKKTRTQYLWHTCILSLVEFVFTFFVIMRHYEKINLPNFAATAELFAFLN